MQDIINKKAYIDSVNGLMIYTDINDKYIIPYENDPSIDNMYQRKSKTKHPKIHISKPMNNSFPSKLDLIGDINKTILENRDSVESIYKIIRSKYRKK